MPCRCSRTVTACFVGTAATNPVGLLAGATSEVGGDVDEAVSDGYGLEGVAYVRAHGGAFEFQVFEIGEGYRVAGADSNEIGLAEAGAAAEGDDGGGEVALVGAIFALWLPVALVVVVEEFTGEGGGVGFRCHACSPAFRTFPG